MISEIEMQAELKTIIRSIGDSVRHAWERYETDGEPKYLALLTDLDAAKNAIAKNIKEE